MTKSLIVLVLLALVFSADASLWSMLFGSKDEKSPVVSQKNSLRAVNKTAFKRGPPVQLLEKSMRPITPAKHSLEQHYTRIMKEKVFQLGHLTQVLFFGDGVFYWLSKNETVWSPLETKYGAISLCGPTDRTENILHRLMDMHFLKNITTAPTIFLNVGKTNILDGHTAGNVAQGILAVVKTLRQQFPRSPLNVFTILPQVSVGPAPPVGIIYSNFNETAAAVNTILLKFKESNTDPLVNYYDLVPSFVPKTWDPNSTLFSTSRIRSVYTSRSPINSRGVQKLVEIITPLLSKAQVLHRPIPSAPIHLHLKEGQKNGTNVSAARKNATRPSVPRNATLPTHSTLSKKQTDKLKAIGNFTASKNLTAVLRKLPPVVLTQVLTETANKTTAAKTSAAKSSTPTKSSDSSSKSVASKTTPPQIKPK